ncbi:MAG: Cys-Gln thioester bond-forming surface protein [Oscillospiraceae bacterium]|nr:Cys-Gln thioester bond-forming surface protein [Oscillospiraceae bacterium]
MDKNKGLKRLTAAVLTAVTMMTMLFAGSFVFAMSPEAEAVKAMLLGIDSLQEMADNREDFRVTSFIDKENEDSMNEHLKAQMGYDVYVKYMTRQRAEAQAAYDALTPEQQAELDPVLVKRLTDIPSNKFTAGTYSLVPSDNEYNYQMIQISGNQWLAYELSQNTSLDPRRNMPCTLIITDSSGDDTTFTPDGPYAYGTNNYEVTYCCDEREPTHFEHHYKRINLEDCDYYNSYQASHIRAIILNAYPYITLEELRENLRTDGFPYADDVDRSDVISAIQFAVWYYSNKLTNEELEKDASYGYTTDAIDYPRASSRLISSVNDYRNELDFWWDANPRYWTYYADKEERVNALRDYFIGLPGIGPAESDIVISKVDIVRSDIDPNTDDTYDIDLNIILNSGADEKDSVTLTITTFTVDGDGNESDPITKKTVTVTGEKEYPVTITAKYGDHVRVVAEGTQDLPKNVYFYQPESYEDEPGNYKGSQALVGVAEGETKVRAKNEFVFERDIETGLRIYKTETETGKPMEGIRFDIYKVEPEEGETLSDEPTEEDLERFAVEANLVDTVTTDSTGYAAIKLDKGTYLLVEENDPTRTKDPVKPMFFTLPVAVETEDEDGNITVDYEEILDLKLVNRPPDEPGSVSFLPAVTKEINDWGDAESFTFELAAVTKGAPMPKVTEAVATRDDPLAEFDYITFYEPGTYEYTITEVDDGVLFVTYDTEPHKITVTVTEVDEPIGYLDIDVAYDDGEESLTVTNSYKVVPAEAVPEVTKEIEDWGDAESFTFKLEAVTKDAPMPSSDTAVATKRKPTAEFGAIQFTVPGDYEYTITEVDDGVPFVTYDTKPHKVVISVSKKGSGLAAEIAYDGKDSLTIVNTYEVIPATVTPKVTKEIEDWGKAETFTFRLEAVTEDAPMPSSDTAVATRDNPVAEFGEISYTEPGTYEYTITEQDDGVEDVTYDTTTHSVTVKVSMGDKGLEAEITYDGEPDLTIVNTRVPRTDDAGSIGMYMITMLLCAAAVIFIRRYARGLSD